MLSMMFSDVMAGDYDGYEYSKIYGIYKNGGI